MLALQTGLSALRANQAALNTVANNIANANTPGYHRQQIRLADRDGFASGNLNLGAGVNAESIYRAFHQVIEDSKLDNQTSLSSVNEQLIIYRQIETILGPGEGSIHTKLNTLFADLRTLSTEPDNTSKRSILVDRLQALTNEINTISQRVDDIEKELDRQIGRDVESVNRQLTEVFEINQKIRKEIGAGRQPNDLLDQFYEKINNLNELIDVQVRPTDNGGFSLQFSNGTYHYDSNLLQFEKVGGAFEETKIVTKGTDVEINAVGGRIAAYQKIKNTDLQDIRDRLGSLTNQFLFELDRVHSTGLPISGEFRALTATRQIDEPAIPLLDASAFKQIEAGSIYVSVTELATGSRTLEKISFDPATQSLDDLASALGAIGNLSTQVSPNGYLSVFSAGGYEFDFAGRFATSVDTSGLTGTSVPNISGSYTGEDNDIYSFTAVGNGTIGVTDGLQVQVTDQAGSVIGTFDVGAGYEPGSPIDIGDGVQLNFTSGTIVNGESFSTDVVAQADETGVLAAVGLNSLFEGTGPTSIKVNQAILDDASRLAFSRNGLPGDGANLERLSALRDVKTVDNLTFEEFIEQINIDVAQEISLLTVEQTNFEIIGNQIDKEIDSISGVDPNEEMVYLLQYQKAYEASVHVISTIDELLSELFSIIR